jgi:hypothetical protein
VTQVVELERHLTLAPVPPKKEWRMSKITLLAGHIIKISEQVPKHNTWLEIPALIV